MILRFNLPLPPKELSPNARVHWRKKHAATQRAKDAARFFCIKEFYSHDVRPATDRVSISCTWVPAKRGLGLRTCCPIDDDNRAGAFKGYRDGIALALGRDDKAFSAIHRRRPRTDDDNEFGTIEVTVTIEEPNDS